MPTSGIVQLPTPANQTGKIVNTFEGTVNAVTVENQAVTISDPTTLSNGAQVSALNADAQSVSILGLVSQALNLLFNGSSMDRQRSGSAANLAATVGGVGAALVTRPGDWAINNTPAAAAQATISRTAGGSGVRHVCTSISYSLAVDQTHAQTEIQLNLRDGATGAGTVLWSLTLFKAATEGITVHAITGLNIYGTANTAMTLEFSGAGVAGSFESVSLTGYDTV